VIAQKKQADIMKAVIEIETLLVTKYKADNSGTFGFKIKQVQDKIQNPFVIDSIWQILKIRNFIVHPGTFDISLKEYELFRNSFDYIKKIEKI
jgi:hypothetical protein